MTSLAICIQRTRFLPRDGDTLITDCHSKVFTSLASESSFFVVAMMTCCANVIFMLHDAPRGMSVFYEGIRMHFMNMKPRFHPPF